MAEIDYSSSDDEEDVDYVPEKDDSDHESTEDETHPDGEDHQDGDEHTQFQFSEETKAKAQAVLANLKASG